MGNGNRPTPEFRREAVRLTLNSGRTLREIAEDLGIGSEAGKLCLRAVQRWGSDHNPKGSGSEWMKVRWQVKRRM